MNEAQTITQALHGDWRNGFGLAPCPICQPEARRDQRALSISEQAGRLLLCCHKGGCKVFPELQARGLIEGRGQHTAPPDPAEVERRKHRTFLRSDGSGKADVSIRCHGHSPAASGNASQTLKHQSSKSGRI